MEQREKSGRAVTENDWKVLEARPRTGKRGKRVTFKGVADAEVSLFFMTSRARHMCMCCAKPTVRLMIQDVDTFFA